MTVEIVKVEVIDDEWIDKHFPSLKKKEEEKPKPKEED